MEKRSTPFPLLLGPPLIAMGLAASVAYLLTDDTPKAPAARVEPSVQPVPAPAPSIRPRPPEPALAMRTLPPAPTPAPVAPAPASAAPEAGPAEAAMAVLAQPKMREHAQLMVTESAKMALKKRDLMQLQRLRETLRNEAIEQAISATDLQAIDLGIECLSQGRDAKARITEFLDENPSSPLAERLREACP